MINFAVDLASEGEEMCDLLGKFTSGTSPRTLPTARGMFLSRRAVHHQLSAVAKSYPQVQRFLAEGSDRALGKL